MNLAPRHAFALGGLLMLSLAAWADRHLFAFAAAVIADADHVQEPDVLSLAARRLDEDALRARMTELSPEVAAAQQVRDDLEALEEAQSTFVNALLDALREHPTHGQAAADQDWSQLARGLDAEGWEPYLAARRGALPPLQAALDAVVASTAAAAAAEPDNGMYPLLGALAQLDQCYVPSPLDPVFNWDDEGDVDAARIQVVDPAALEQHLTTIERALGAERLTLHVAAHQRARLAAASGKPGPLGELERLGALTTLNLSELMFLRASGTIGLTMLARRERLQGRSGERLLRLVRHLALRRGAQGETLIDILIAQADDQIVGEAWLLEATTQGDTQRALAITDELHRLQRERDRSMRQDLPRERLSLIDWFMLPAGGWGAGWSPEVGLAADFAYLESAALWLLALVALGLLLRAALLARRPADPGASLAPWTLGDLLAVVLPSLGAATALILCVFRLHPLSQVGLGAGAIESRLFQLGFPVFAGLFSFSWLLRRQVLAKAGLAFARPRAARTALVLALGAAVLGIDWVGPWSMSLAPLALSLAASAVALGAWSGATSLSRLPASARPALVRYRGRVGLACLGAGLTLIATVLLCTSVRRERLTRALVDQHVELFQQEASGWGNGQLIAAFREVLSEAPHRPLSREERRRQR